MKQTLGKVSKSISTMAASRYSLHASAFLAICSDSALALAAMADASASPRIRIYTINENIKLFLVLNNFCILPIQLLLQLQE